jgi:predicted phosphodiesterase
MFVQPPTFNQFERYLIISDLHIPDVNREALEAIYEFIPDFRPHYLVINGDFLNCTTISNFDPDPYYDVQLSDELDEGREILHKLDDICFRSNTQNKMIFIHGNHEARLLKYLSRNAKALAKLKIGGEYALSFKHLLGFKDLEIDSFEYGDCYPVGESVVIEHGDMARSKAGYTATGMLEKRGISGISGHTHRAGMIMKKRGKNLNFWIEQGCLCNLNPTPRYIAQPDWQNAFAIGYHDVKNDVFYPELINMFDSQFVYGGKLYGKTQFLSATRTKQTSAHAAV